MKGAFARLLAELKASSSGTAEPGEGSAPREQGQARPRVVIQTHDFPDHDAAASAFGLGRLLGRCGYEALLRYRGLIRSHSLKSMINGLNIPLVKVAGMAEKELLRAPCIIVDGNPLNTNARQVTENLFAVIDHHPGQEKTGGPPAVPPCAFADIRPGCGSCAAIIAAYWKEAGFVPDKEESTALLMGIEIDTDFLSRRVSRLDLDAFHRLFFNADWQFGARNIKTSLSKKDLPALELAVSGARIKKKLYFTVITVDTSQEVISILADLFLRLREISVSVIIESRGSIRHVSVRSRDPAVSAARVVRRALEGIGEGGGHDHMAGGLLSTEIDEEKLFQRFTEAIDKEEHPSA
ncbi:MAG: DHH family phosphoesterase [Treponema sp.]|jgi:nanoRNase/pAp phosphatase (c-di-AMP/oligoRNAs hydrolase)|nr:DHH family phosphoesterase [Treponema sp.]